MYDIEITNKTPYPRYEGFEVVCVSEVFDATFQATTPFVYNVAKQTFRKMTNDELRDGWLREPTRECINYGFDQIERRRYHDLLDAQNDRDRGFGSDESVEAARVTWDRAYQMLQRRLDMGMWHDLDARDDEE